MDMQEIIEKINVAEEKAAQIKANALSEAAEIAAAAEERAADIDRLAEVDCKTIRESSQKSAQEEAQRRYDNEITVNRAKASQYCADRLKDTDKIVNDIVLRVTRGSR